MPPLPPATPPVIDRYRPDIDGLRAIAVLLVVIFHAFPRFIKGGFIGVDVFFVISGYLISSLIFVSLENDRFSYIEFYSRRIKRILPVLILVIVSCAAFGWYVLLADEYRQLGAHIMAGAGFVSNFVLWSEAGYFDRQSFEKPLLHLWSLAIEEQFYIVWPLLLGWAWRRKWNILWVIALILSGSLLIEIWLTGSDEIAAFYAPWSRFWELMTGCALAHITRHRPQSLWFLSLQKNWQSAIGLTLIFLAALLLSKQSAFPGWWALLPTIGTFLVINAGPDASLNRRFLSGKKMVWIGLLSYSLYLWHWPIISFIHIISFKKSISPAVFILAILASFLVAWISYRFFERKIRYSAKRATPIVLLIACLFCILLGFSIQQQKLLARNDGIDLGFMTNLQESQDFKAQLKTGKSNDFTYYFIDTQARENVLFIGDSHIWQYIPRLLALSKNPDFAMKFTDLAVINACPVIPEVFDEVFPKCKESWPERLRLALSPNIDSVVIGGCWNCILSSAVEKPVLSAADDPRKQRALALLEGAIKQIAAVKKVYLLLDNPNNPLFNPRNFFIGSRLTEIKLRDLHKPIPLDPEQAALRNELIAIAQRAGAIVIDPLPALCPDNQCQILDGEGKPIYIDNHHLSPSWVIQHADYLDSSLQITGEKP